MPRFTLRFPLFVVVLLAVVLAVQPAWADDEGDDGEQQGQVEGGEEGAEGGDAEGGDAEGEGAEGEDDEQPRQGIGDGDPSQFQNAPGGGPLRDGDEEEMADLEQYREFHPTYKLEQKRDQDVASWTHTFVLNYPLSRTISFTSGANIGTRTNDAANRLNRQETWSAGLDVRATSAITTGLTFRRNRHLDVQNEGKSNETRSEREKETVKLTTGYTKIYQNGMDVSLGASAGIEKNAYTNVRSRGSTQGITGRISFKPVDQLNTTFTYNGGHSLLDSEQGALKSTDESVNHDLMGRIDYGWGGHKFTVDMRQATSKKEYPKDEQTELKEQDSESTGVTAELDLLEGLMAKLVFNYSRNQHYYRVEPSRNSDVSSRAVEAHLTYSAGETAFKADMTSDRKRNDYFDVQTGDNYSNAVTMSLSHRFKEGLDATLKGRMSLLSVHYDDMEANDQDRDLFDREASLMVNYRVGGGITTGLSVRVRDDQLIYIRRSRTGDNKTTQKYAIEPSIRKSFTPRFSASQRYTLSADYTFYQYDTDSNFLIRNMSVTSGLTWKPFTPLDLSLEHTYRSQDEGSYVENEQGVEAYGKSSERVDQTLSLKLGYVIADLINIEVKQNLSVQDKWRITTEGRNKVWDKYDTSIVGRASADYSLPNGTTLKASVARTHRDATSISDRQREVWNTSITLNRTF